MLMLLFCLQLLESLQMRHQRNPPPAALSEEPNGL